VLCIVGHSRKLVILQVRMASVFADALLEWYGANARDLPWRHEPRDPYLVLVSEIMLQQTQVDRVVGFFGEFVRRFPNLESLASSPEAEVLGAWSGLGYYRRARLLHRLAREVAACGGGLPTSAASLRALPGIGPYTASAVASLAYGEKTPVLDGNTMRVGARVLAMKTDPRSAEGRRRLEKWMLTMMEDSRAGRINEALMELGATVCSPSAPSCGSCPLADGCMACLEGRQEAYPLPRRRRASVELRWVVVCCIDSEGWWLVRRIDEGPILRGLWLPPLAEPSEEAAPETEAIKVVPVDPESSPIVGPTIRHTITHRKIGVIPVRIDVCRFEPPSDSWCWVDPRNPGVPTSSLLAKLVTALTDGHP
jgi:A/G-specific adenine glycosylase